MSWMKWNTYGEEMRMRKMKFLTYVLAILFLLGQSLEVCAGDATPIVIDGEVYNWSEKMDVKVEKVSDKEVHVTAAAVEAEELYNYATVSSMFEGAYKKKVYQNEYAAITMAVENPTDASIFLNLSLADKDNNQLVMKENAYIIREVNGEKNAEKVNFSSVEIEAGFKGAVTIPLSMLEDGKQNAKKFDYEKLTSWSVGALVKSNQALDFYVKGLAWQDQEYLQQYEKSLGTYIEGADTVQIPEHGESIEFYQIASGVEHTYQFVNEGLAQGISIDKTGKLVLDTTVEEQTINIEAIDESGTKISKEITLVYSWRKKSEKGFFYGPEELEKIEYPFDEITESHVVIARWVLLIGCAIVFVSYIVFYAKYQKDKKREEE